MLSRCSCLVPCQPLEGHFRASGSPQQPHRRVLEFPRSLQEAEVPSTAFDVEQTRQRNSFGADFFISAIGPALSVFGKYERVTKLSGDEVSVGQFLDEVRSLVTAYALSKIMKTTHTANIDPDTQFYVIWKWSYGEAKVPADEAFKLAQALGMDTETMWNRTGILEKSGENVQAVP